MNMQNRFLLILLMLIVLPVKAASTVITLQYRMAEDILPVAQSVVGERGRVSAYGNQLVVSASNPVIAELWQVIQQLDREPKRLLISVDTRRSAQDSRHGYNVAGKTRAGDVEIVTEAGDRQSGLQTRIIRHSVGEQSSGIQQIHTLEGSPALLRLGQSVPLTQSGIDAYGRYRSETQYSDVMRGFYATATVTGDQVQIMIDSQQDRLSSQYSNVVERQDTRTLVSGRLGEWIEVGSMSSTGAIAHEGLLRQNSTTARQDLSLRLKVELIE